ncbi:MAG: hypothetical protein KG012_04235 [Deltaproteobacteria bacterium]|nr:hypothetical protein [Deltaproteobacteria bacterium]
MTVILPKKDAVATRGKVWRVIRGLPGGFTFDEIATITESPQGAVTTYLIILSNAGYIRQAGKRKEADGRRKVVWRLARNTGPKAPVPCRCLYDPNIDEVKAVDRARNPSSVNGQRTRTRITGTNNGGRHVD